jgi:hypothetical protein
MPFNGSGLFVLPSPEYPAVAGTIIYASTRNTIDSDIAAGLSNVICKDGQTTVTANIPFNGFKLTNVGTPTVRSDAATLGTVQDGMPPLTTTGSSTAYQISPVPPIPSYVAGYSVVVQFHTACGNNPTLQISGLASPPNLVKRNTDGTLANLASNDVPANWRSRVVLLSATQALVEQIPLLGRLVNIVRYTSPGSGTYNKPSNVTRLLIRAVGGGGSGASGSNTVSGGGAGGYAEKFITSPSSSYNYTVGAGGAGVGSGNAGNPGGTTTIAGMTASGGDGGTIGTGAGAAGGTASGGDINIIGGGGTHGNLNYIGSGGSSTLAGGGALGTGKPGFGAGSASSAGGTSSPGGDGYIEIWEFE